MPGSIAHCGLSFNPEQSYNRAEHCGFVKLFVQYSTTTPYNAHSKNILSTFSDCCPPWLPTLSNAHPHQVTRLERDASSGTALQEISFWMNLEHALGKIHSRRHSPEVQLTLDVLKAGKRFHATVSFDADTGEQSICRSLCDVCVCMNLYIQCMHKCEIEPEVYIPVYKVHSMHVCRCAWYSVCMCDVLCQV